MTINGYKVDDLIVIAKALKERDITPEELTNYSEGFKDGMAFYKKSINDTMEMLIDKEIVGKTIMQN